MTNALFWANYIENVFLPQIDVLQETIVRRLLPTFNSIESEAEQISQDTWARLSDSASLDADPASLAEDAHESGVDHYLMMVETKQAIMNLFAVAIHHLVEQQQLLILRRELLPRSEENNHSLLNQGVFISRLQSCDIDPTQYESWAILQELRDVANAVKHAEGRAVESLRSRRPDLFVFPDVNGVQLSSILSRIRSVYMPLSGQDIFVNSTDLTNYSLAAMDFWRSLQTSLQENI